MSFPQQLKNIRNLLELTQCEFMEVLGVSEKTLKNYESGRSFPDCNIIERLNIIYNVNPNYLFGCSSEPFLHKPSEINDILRVVEELKEKIETLEKSLQYLKN